MRPVVIALLVWLVAPALLAGLGLPVPLAAALSTVLLLLLWGRRLLRIFRTGVMRPIPVGQWILRSALRRLLPLRLLWWLVYRTAPPAVLPHLDALFEPVELHRDQEPWTFRQAFFGELKVFAFVALFLSVGLAGAGLEAAERAGLLPQSAGAHTADAGRAAPSSVAHARPVFPVAEHDVEPVTALRLSGPPRLHAEALAAFTLAGERMGSALLADSRLRHVAAAPSGRVFALTRHDVGWLSAEAGGLVELPVDADLDFSWPSGIAVSPSGQVLVLTSHVYTRLYRGTPDASGGATWERLPAELRDVPMVGLAWWPGDEALHALGVGRSDRVVETLHRFSAEGEWLGTTALDPPIPAPDDGEGLQLAATGAGLLVLLPPGVGPRAFLVDPATGRVAAAPPGAPDPVGRAAAGSAHDPAERVL